MVSVDQAYMVGHMKNADGSINYKNVVLSAACEAAELFQCMMSVNQKLEDWQRFNHTLEMHLRSVECEKIHDICQAVYGMKHPSNELEGLYLAREDEQMANMPMEEREIIMDKMVAASRDILETIADMGYLDEYETPLTSMEERNYRDELGQLDVDQISCDGYEFGMDLAFGILEENEENADRVLDIQQYVNRQNKKCSKKKFMKVLETLVHAIGNDEGFIADMYACDKEARKIYLEEAMNAFNYVLDELCHGTGSAANCDFDVEE